MVVEAILNQLGELAQRQGLFLAAEGAVAVQQRDHVIGLLLPQFVLEAQLDLDDRVLALPELLVLRDHELQPQELCRKALHVAFQVRRQLVDVPLLLVEGHRLELAALRDQHRLLDLAQTKLRLPAQRLRVVQLPRLKIEFV